jgi:hypothetical protein
MSRAKAKSRTTRHSHRDSATELSFGIDLWHSSVRRAIAAVALTSLLAAFAGPATAHEPSIHPSIALASDLAPQQLGQGKPADTANPPAHHTPEVTASAFDLANLPSIDSIGAQTDITVFLRSGVPEELRLAALRLAWTMDPAIRDFKELAENDWDFNDLNSIPGFAELVPEPDVKTMLALMAGEAPRLAERSDEPFSPSLAANALRRIFGAVVN